MENLTENITDSEIDLDLLKPQYTVIVLYVFVMIWALLANLTVIYIVFKYVHMRNVTNYLLVNLSVADLLVTLICMPNEALRAYSHIYYFGEFLCKTSAYMQCVAVATSIFTITAMAVDRYLVINKPFEPIFRCFNKRNTIILIIALWTFPAILFLPMPFATEYLTYQAGNSTNPICKETWYKLDGIVSPSVLGFVWFSFTFVIPGTIMLYAYSMMGKFLCSMIPPFDRSEVLHCAKQRHRIIRSRKRVAIILLLLAFVFAICWLPYQITILLIDLEVISPTDIGNTQRYLLLLGHTNSALGPVVYCALSRKFRDSIKDCCCSNISTFKRNSLDSSGYQMPLYVTRAKQQQVKRNLDFNASLLQSSQRSTKTCAV